MYLIALIFFTHFWPSLVMIDTRFIPCPSSSSAGLSEHAWLHSATVQACSARRRYASSHVFDGAVRRSSAKLPRACAAVRCCPWGDSQIPRPCPEGSFFASHTTDVIEGKAAKSCFGGYSSHVPARLEHPPCRRVAEEATGAPFLLQKAASPRDPASRGIC